ncbi:aspartate-semialdehyde dehydrogenase [bacterium]|nr:aspartate-semialdehyde dehydrogenase [bacterium]
MMKGYRVAIIGATGLVGDRFIESLEELKFPVRELVLYASSLSRGAIRKFQGKDIIVRELTRAFDPVVDLALFSAGSKISLEYSPLFAGKGAWVIDNSSAFRRDEDKALVVPEINFETIRSSPSRIIANPNCSTIQLVMVLAALRSLAPLKRIVVSTYQSVTGAGREGLEALHDQRRGGTLQGPFEFPILDNLVPKIGKFDDPIYSEGEDGYTTEELKLIKETQKILEQPDLKVTATAVRVPVSVGHSESVNVEFEEAVELDRVHEVLRTYPGLVVREPNSPNFPTPLEARGRYEVFVGRIRRDYSRENCLNMWIVADNLVKGAAGNAVQIALKLVKVGLL